MYMWHAVDSEGEVLENLVQPQRDKAAAVRLLRKLLPQQSFVPTVIVTDRLDPTERRFAKLATRVYMSKDGAPTIARRIRISRLDDVNEKCKASPFTTHSTCNGIWSAGKSIDNFGPQRIILGAIRRLRRINGDLSSQVSCRPLVNVSMPIAHLFVDPWSATRADGISIANTRRSPLDANAQQYRA